MPCARTWSAQSNKPEIKLNVRQIEWKTLMSECLMGEEIFKKCENESEELCMNPNSAMDLRHKMVKDSSRELCTPQIQTQTEALKLLRISNYNKMLKQKEGKLIEKEISRLKETLENTRHLIQENLNAGLKYRAKPSRIPPKLVNSYSKQCKRLELQDGVYEVDTWLSHSVRMTMETKINQQGIPFNVKVSLKRQGQAEEYKEPTPTLDGSVIAEKTPAPVKQISVENEGKHEIMRRFFEESKKLINEELDDSVKVETINRIREIQKIMNGRIISHAWATWKHYTQQNKSLRREKNNCKNKIEAFLSKLQDAGTKEGKRNKTSNHEKSITCSFKVAAKNRINQIKNEKKERYLKKIMEEVKTSQAETYQTLQEISKNNLKNRENSKNLKFLKRIEERREERLKRWREIEMKKIKLEEEKKRAEKQKEDEKKKKEEENRRRKMEESREKRRLQMEEKKEREREREKLRLNIKAAESHYRKYLVRAYGLRPWLMLIKIRDSLQQRAVEFYERKLTTTVFSWLVSNVRQQKELKYNRASEFHERMLKKNYLRLWLEFHLDGIKQNQVASDWNDFRLTERAFQKWLQFTQNEQLEFLSKKDIAVLNYERKLKMKFFKKLRDYPEFKKLELAKENRKRKWRQRVKEILPDYQPAETCSTVFA